MLNVYVAVDLLEEYQCRPSEFDKIILEQIPEISFISHNRKFQESYFDLSERKTDILFASLDFIHFYSLQNLNRQFPGLKIIIASRDTRAENIIELFHQGIYRYLLLPDLFENLVMTLRDCTHQIIKGNRELAHWEQRIRFLDWMLWDQIFYELVTNPLKTEQCMDALSDHPFQLRKMQEAFTVSLFIGGIEENTAQEKENAYLQVREFLQNFCGNNGVVFRVVNPGISIIQMGILFARFSTTLDWSKQKVIDVLKNRSEHFTKGQNFWLQMGIGSCVSSCEELPNSFHDSLNATYYAYPFLRTVLVDCEQNSLIKKELVLQENSIRQLTQAAGNAALFELQLDHLILCLNSQEVLPWSQLQIAAIQILTALEKQIDPELAVCVAKLNTLCDFRRFVLSLLKVPARAACAKSELIEKAKRLIYEQYSDPDLSLNSAAQRSFVSPSYLSYIFKKEMGVSFIEYISMVRMDRAKDLCIGKDMKISEIGRLVGYRDSSYFSTCFKKIVGITPSQYQKNKKNE